MSLRQGTLWAVLCLLIGVPIVVAAQSPLLAWRSPIYIFAGFAGIGGLVLLLIQPLLARAALPGISMARARRAHQWAGVALTLSVILHVAGLWVTSPPDVFDALLFRSPTPFSVWGVAAMWALFIAAGLAVFRRRLRLNPRVWRKLHVGLAGVVTIGTVLHAVLIQGTMGTFSKWVLCLAVLTAAGAAVWPIIWSRK